MERYIVGSVVSNYRQRVVVVTVNSDELDESAYTSTLSLRGQVVQGSLRSATSRVSTWKPSDQVGLFRAGWFPKPRY